MVFAIKPVYCRASKTYEIDMIPDVHAMSSYAMQGYILIDEANRERVADEIEAGTSRMRFKKPEQAVAVVRFLREVSFVPNAVPSNGLTTV